MARKHQPRWYKRARKVIQNQHSRWQLIDPHHPSGLEFDPYKVETARLIALVDLEELVHKLLKIPNDGKSIWDEFQPSSAASSSKGLPFMPHEDSLIAQAQRIFKALYQPTIWGIEPLLQEWKPLNINPLIMKADDELRPHTQHHATMQNQRGRWFPSSKESVSELLERLQKSSHSLRKFAEDPSIRNRLRSARKRSKKIDEYLRDCFRCNPKPRLMIRVDLGAHELRPHHFTPEGRIWLNPDNLQLHAETLEELIMRRILARHKPQRDWLNRWTGYLVKRQYDFDKGYYWHLIMFFDPNTVGSHPATMENDLSEAWKEVTREQDLTGLCWGANRDIKARTPERGSLLLPKSKNLPIRELAFYLGDLDYIAHVHRWDNRHNLRHPQSPSKKSAPKRSRSTVKNSAKQPKKTLIEMGSERLSPLDTGNEQSQGQGFETGSEKGDDSPQDPPGNA
ncbi:hypothetical protein HH1059_13990 [Halorhodospira halochloris]|uniref:Uncharacterized protein n=1 Tax=Halorhodospira halochloris TaxID=1052 RepID=A0A0X8XB21_HALHR|nr:hypothetical protein [Halorhodospira halochloris]MBK1652556.1 hypothetical protein [Halorhodospira halochloris]BAU58143.1 hypothetical protein HH1059_14380 [Halorhodospira halochloris]BBE11072.1 hypothetical protein HH1059_13990 [Halorhodospira halochloris]